MDSQEYLSEQRAGELPFVQKQAFDALFIDLRDQLKRKASILCRNERSPSFSTGDLLNDLYIRLQKNPAYALAISAQGRLHFMRMASEAMRHILTDAARTYKKRNNFAFISLSHADERTEMALSPESLIGLDEALTALEQTHPRRAAIMKMRFYSGLSIRELQEYWGIADATVERDIHLSLKVLYELLRRKTE